MLSFGWESGILESKSCFRQGPQTFSLDTDGAGAAGAAALLYKFFSSGQRKEELNFEKDLSRIEGKFSMSDSCIIRPSLTPNSAAKLPNNKVIIGKN